MRILIGIVVVSIALVGVACGSVTEDHIIKEDKAKSNEEATMKQYDSPPPMVIDKSKRYSATIEVENLGEIVVELYPNEAPVTVNNFVFLVREGYYDNLTFHRVIADFMAQTGDPTGTGSGGPGYKFDNELSPDRRHDGPGVLSMANAGTRNGQGTNGSQFFITFRATSWLDGYNPDGTPKDCNSESCHTVFGKVTEGLSTVLNLPIRDPGTATEPGARISKITVDESD